jgi:hypothetical protein
MMKSREEKNMKLSTGISLMAITFVYGCKKPYAPPAITVNNSYLVVEGLIAAGQDSTIIKLSRTVNLSGTTTINPELNATVTVQGDQNVSYSLPQIDSGKYGVPPLNLDNSHKYRLLITTTDEKTYTSDYEPVTVTPPIDSLFFNTDDKGININLNTHDPSNSTRYYRWDYTETYIYQSDIETHYIFDPTQPDTLKWAAFRTPEQQIHTCYVTLNSSIVDINSSAALSRDVIINNPITQIAMKSEKIEHRYSILVKQYALTKEAYNFWNLLKSNTQKIGNIFDVQPSINIGNIHCTSNPSLPVIGYVSVGTISQKRIFIDRSDLPAWPVPAPLCDPNNFKPNPECWKRVSIYAPAFVPAELKAGTYIPIGIIDTVGKCYRDSVRSFSVPTVYYACADCRVHLGGKTQKPAFWK